MLSHTLFNLNKNIIRWEEIKMDIDFKDDDDDEDWDDMDDEDEDWDDFDEDDEDI